MGVDYNVDKRLADGVVASKVIVVPLATVARPVDCNVTSRGDTVEKNPEMFA